MLRQQQAEYYSLLVNHDKLYAKVIEQQAEIEALKKEAALQRLSDFTQEADNEPVAWRSKDTDGHWNIYQAPVKGAEPLYTHPADLTDEEIWKLWQKHLNDEIPVFARAILRKAQEK